MLCIPLHCRGRAGEYRFSALSGPKCSKTCTPPRPRPSNPQPCLLLLRRSNECRFPSHHTKTAHALYSPALPRARGGSTGFQHFQAANVPKPVLPRVRGPATPNPAYCFSEEATNVGFLPTIQTQHMLCIPLHCRGCGGVQVFRLSGPTCSKAKTCTPPRPRPSTHNPALLLLRRSNECRFPSHHHVLCIPLHCRGRGRVQVFSTFRPQMFQNLYSPASAAQQPPTLLIASPKKQRM